MKNKLGKHYLPVSKKELDYLGWTEVDVIIITGDAYIDHPSFGAAIIGRLLEQLNLRVAILPQPNWKDDLRDFKKLGKPGLFFGITAGNMDSMVNHYTANKRLRSNDAYTPGGATGFRPDYASIVYSNIVKQLYPNTPVVLGGIEASMRRLSHYDFWKDLLRPSILIESKADFLIYGMGEKAIVEFAKTIASENGYEKCKNCKQTAYITDDISTIKEDKLILFSYDEELKNKKKYGENFVAFETETNKKNQKTIIQKHTDKYVVINPPYPTPSTADMDSWALYDVMMNAPHPKYLKRGTIPAFEMIKNSITIHRGCFGGCSFCAISAHQGKFVSSRSIQSVIDEAYDLTKRDYFKGHISDLGGPSANMYQMSGKNKKSCEKCLKNSCLHPDICDNLNRDHSSLIQLYKAIEAISGVKKITIGSGIRYEMLVAATPDKDTNKEYEYLELLIKKHVSGRLKVAPEHTEKAVTDIMRKPDFEKYVSFLKQFNIINNKYNTKQQLIPYFISAHPGCRMSDMFSLAKKIKKLHILSDQVQTFTPTPMTYSTAMYYLKYDPYTGNAVYVENSIENRKKQHDCFF